MVTAGTVHAAPSPAVVSSAPPRLSLAIVLTFVFLCACVVYLLGPITALFLAAFSRGELNRDALPWTNDPEEFFAVVASTLRKTAGATALACALGVPVALAIHRARGAYQKFLAAVFPIPLLLPPAVVAVAWTHLLGKRGLAAAAWFSFTGEKQLPFSIYGEAGSACMLALCWFPLVTMSTLVGLRATGTTSVRSARLFAGPWRRGWSIGLPLLLPYLSAGAVFVAWLALGDFEIPQVLLLKSLPDKIYGSFQVKHEYGKALGWCLPILGLSAVVLAIRQFLIRGGAAPVQDSRGSLEETKPHAATPYSASGHRLLTFAALAILFAAVVVPVASLVHQAEAWANVQMGLETAGREILNSFHMAFAASLLMLVVATPYARLLTRRRGWSRHVLALLALAPLAIPGTVHGLAWTVALNDSEWGRIILENPYIVSMANAARFFPFAVFLIAATLEGLHPRLLDAAKVAGATGPSRWLRVGVPLVYTGFMAVFAIGFSLAVGELSASIMLNPVGASTLPVRLSSLLHFGKDELLAALCLVQVFLGLIPYLAATVLLERTLEVRLG